VLLAESGLIMDKNNKGIFFILISLLFISFVFLSSYQTAYPQSSPERLPKEIAKIRLPKLLDFGANTCIPCKKMAPILQELEEEYKGRVVIKVIEVYQEQKLTRINGIRLIPTQIFFDSKNQEVYRHVGFMDKEQIKKVFSMMGVK
jgi:thioredoxin 1